MSAVQDSGAVARHLEVRYVLRSMYARNLTRRSQHQQVVASCAAQVLSAAAGGEDEGCNRCLASLPAQSSIITIFIPALSTFVQHLFYNRILSSYRRPLRSLAYHEIRERTTRLDCQPCLAETHYMHLPGASAYRID